MPIRPENKARYPENWKEIRDKILKRANYNCEFCGVENYSYGYRTLDGLFVKVSNIFEAYWAGRGNHKLVKIVLTIAHLDHMPENNDESNLKALCQRCHNRYDMKHRIANRKKNKINASLNK